MRRLHEELSEMRTRELRHAGSDEDAKAAAVERHEVLGDALDLLDRGLHVLENFESDTDHFTLRFRSETVRDTRLKVSLDWVRKAGRTGVPRLSPSTYLAKAAETARQAALRDLEAEIRPPYDPSPVKWSDVVSVMQVMTVARPAIIEKADRAVGELRKGRDPQGPEADLPRWLTDAVEFAEEWERLENRAATLGASTPSFAPAP